MGDGQRRIIVIEGVVREILFRFQPQQLRAARALFLVGRREIIRQNEAAAGSQSLSQLSVQRRFFRFREVMQRFDGDGGVIGFLAEGQVEIRAQTQSQVFFGEFPPQRFQHPRREIDAGHLGRGHARIIEVELQAGPAAQIQKPRSRFLRQAGRGEGIKLPGRIDTAQLVFLVTRQAGVEERAHLFQHLFLLPFPADRFPFTASPTAL